MTPICSGSARHSARLAPCRLRDRSPPLPWKRGAGPGRPDRFSH